MSTARAVDDAPADVVDTVSGPVRGVRRGACDAYLGIPYAAAPVGTLRFAAPQPAPAWTSVRDATRMGATPQRGSGGAATLIPEPSVPGDEVLCLNVFTPASRTAAASLPVWVHVHGGGFVSGSPASPWYDGASFARDGVVTVTVAYRLGMEGFGVVPGAPANRGLRDVIAALHWVRENIARFGGDPDAVTLSGQSAGAGVVLALVASPAAGLFRAAWASSPVLADITEDAAHGFAAAVAAHTGVPATRAGFASVDRDALDAAQLAVTGRGTPGLWSVLTLVDHGYRLGPTIDGEILDRPVLEALAAGAGSDVALVVGANDDEFGMVAGAVPPELASLAPDAALTAVGVPAPVAQAYVRAGVAARGASAVLARWVGDRVFRSVVARTLRAREDAAAGGAATWAYRFAWRSPVRGGAVHCLDIPFLFDLLDAERVDRIAGDHPPRALAAAVHGAAVEFARTGVAPWAAARGPADRTSPTRVFDDPDGGTQPGGWAGALACGGD
ncbi:carboxylesterase/lipase family protein [Microbacterium sp.]|uniref:carboxylesterase/lipase family protein n=1 Tax=Microbacterium sp. TaxID=51671 RepID=UPI0039E3B9B6